MNAKDWSKRLNQNDPYTWHDMTLAERRKEAKLVAA